LAPRRNLYGRSFDIPIERFVKLLKTYGIKQLVDIRTIPASRHNPQFGSDALARSLRMAHIKYAHMPALGGLRRARKDSINTGWRNSSFRGYAADRGIHSRGRGTHSVGTEKTYHDHVCRGRAVAMPPLSRRGRTQCAWCACNRDTVGYQLSPTQANVLRSSRRDIDRLPSRAAKFALAGCLNNTRSAAQRGE
jgi:hypothetical protein